MIILEVCNISEGIDTSGMKCFNPISTNIPISDKPGNWFLLGKCLKNTCGRVRF